MQHGYLVDLLSGELFIGGASVPLQTLETIHAWKARFPVAMGALQKTLLSHPCMQYNFLFS